MNLSRSPAAITSFGPRGARGAGSASLGMMLAIIPAARWPASSTQTVSTTGEYEAVATLENEATGRAV